MGKGIVATIAGIAIVFFIVSLCTTYAVADTSNEWRIVEGSPPVLMFINDSYKSDDLASATDADNFSGRNVVVYDKKGQVVEEFNLDESGNVVYPSVICRSIAGNQSVHFFSGSDSFTPDEVTFSIIQEFFDEQMRLSKKNTYNQDKEGTACLTYTESREYTDNIETIMKFNRDGYMVSNSIRTLDEKGRVLQIELYTDLNGEMKLTKKHTFEYNAADNIARESLYHDSDSPWIVYVYEYDSLNRESKCVTYFYGQKTDELVYEYTEDGEMHYLVSEGKRILKYGEELNEYGEIAWTARWNEEQQRVNWIEYVYSGRDEYGNWTKDQRIFHAAARDGEVTSVNTTIRRIVYYPEIANMTAAGEAG